MKPLSFILSLFLALPLCVSAQDPSFWDDPYVGTPKDTVSEPAFWDDPYIGIKPDESPEPGLWDDPYITENSIVVITDAGLPANINALYESQAEVTIELHRNLVGGMYNTLCLPFDIDDVENSPLQNSKVIEYEEALMVDNMLNLYFNYTNSIIGGRPYLIMPAENISDPMTFTNAVITAVSGETLSSDVDFVGILEPYQIPYDHATMFLGTNNKLYYSNNDGSSMKGLRAYFAPHIGGGKIPARLCIGKTITTDASAISNDVLQKCKVLINQQLYIFHEGTMYNVLGNKIQ